MGATVRLADVTGPTLDAVYHTILTPSFPADELGTLDSFRSGMDSGGIRMVGMFDDAGAPVGAAVVEWSPQSRVLLLAYLAVLPQHRSSGIGGQLLTHVTGTLREEFGARAVLAEIEHPAVHHGSERYGDPVARLRFYDRHGGRAMLVPYFQPALDKTLSRVFGLILSALWVGPESVGAAADTVDPVMVRQFLVEYFLDTEGVVPDDEPTRRMFAAVDLPTGVPLVSLVDSAAIPFSG
jgi:GNAT superfamily N-acetyltransferase